MSDNIPYGRHWIGSEEKDEVLDTLERGYLTAGPKVELFEEQIRNYLGASYCVAVSSCSAALHLSLLTLGIGPGDEVITTVFSYVATSNAILHVGAIPVFVDIDEIYNIDVQKIEERLTPRTKALLVVHYGGQPCDLKRVRELARKHNLFVVEDASHAIGATYNGLKIGTESDSACFSFHPVKNMTTAEGGIIATRSEKVAELSRALRLHGISEDYRVREKRGYFEYPQMRYLGFKYIMTDLQASLGLQQLKKLEVFLKRREEIAHFYSEELKDLEEIELPRVRPNLRHAWHLYVIKLNRKNFKGSRDLFMEKLAEKGVSTSVHYLPLHLQPYYQERFGFKKGDYPEAEKAYDSILTLPLFPKMTPPDTEKVVRSVKEVVTEIRK